MLFRSSGSKCGKAEGCSWYWGKCTKSSDVPPDTPPPTSTSAKTTSQPSVAASDNSSSPEEQPDGGLMDTAKENIHIVIGLFFGLTSICCMFYCCCCRRNNTSGGKYARASLEPDSIEMTNGNGMMTIDHHIDSFQDELEERNGDFRDNEGSSDSVASGSKTSSKFRDRPNDEPEFEGDFA